MNLKTFFAHNIIVILRNALPGSNPSATRRLPVGYPSIPVESLLGLRANPGVSELVAGYAMLAWHTRGKLPGVQKPVINPYNSADYPSKSASYPSLILVIVNPTAC